MTKDCNLLGELLLDGIPPMPRGQPRIEVPFDFDPNYVLHVTVVEKLCGKEQHIQIVDEMGRLSDKDIDRLLKEAQLHAAEDEANRLRVEAKNSLQNYLYSVKASLINVNSSIVTEPLSETDKESIHAKLTDVSKWLLDEGNFHAECREGNV
jgi:heat shock 70kDa protein 1/2/6/8